MSKRQSLKERLATMASEELDEALRRTAELYGAEWTAFLAQTDDDQGVGFQILEENWDAYAEASNVLGDVQKP